MPPRNTKTTPSPTSAPDPGRGGREGAEGERPRPSRPTQRGCRPGLSPPGGRLFVGLFLSLFVFLCYSFGLSSSASSFSVSAFVTVVSDLSLSLSLSLRVCLPPSWSRCLSRGLSGGGTPRPDILEAGLGREAGASRERGGRGRRAAFAGPGTSKGGEFSLLALTCGAGPLEACGAVACGAPPFEGGHACRLP